jgi:hypothetical protein
MRRLMQARIYAQRGIEASILTFGHCRDGVAP